MRLSEIYFSIVGKKHLLSSFVSVLQKCLSVSYKYWLVQTTDASFLQYCIHVLAELKKSLYGKLIHIALKCSSLCTYYNSSLQNSHKAEML